MVSRFLLLLSSFSLVQPARADVAPGPFYREDCTVEKKEQEGTTCEACSSWYGAGEDTAGPTCEEQYEGTAFEYACQSEGASTWTEVWCDGPPRESGCGCAASPTGADMRTGGVVGLVLLGVLWRRRRQDSPVRQ